MRQKTNGDIRQRIRVTGEDTSLAAAGPTSQRSSKPARLLPPEQHKNGHE